MPMGVVSAQAREPGKRHVLSQGIIVSSWVLTSISNFSPGLESCQCKQQQVHETVRQDLPWHLPR